MEYERFHSRNRRMSADSNRCTETRRDISGRSRLGNGPADAGLEIRVEIH